MRIRNPFFAVALAALFGCASSSPLEGPPASDGAAEDPLDSGGEDGGTQPIDGSATDGPPPDAPLNADASQCPADEPAGETFTFHLHNASSIDLQLDLGTFGADPPIDLHTPAGTRGIGPEDVNECGFSCELTLSSRAPTGCSGGSRYTLDIPAGETRDLEWDRRVWEGAEFAAACKPEGSLNASTQCALGRRVTGVVSGELTVCTHRLTQSCVGGYETALPIEVDLAQDEMTVELPSSLPVP